MEWLEPSLAGHGAVSPPRSREAQRSGKRGPGPGAPHRWRPCRLPGSALGLLGLLCEAGGFGGLGWESSPSWAGK